MTKKSMYLTPATEVVLVKMEAKVLSGSQSWPSGAPANAHRNGYGEAISEDW